VLLLCPRERAQGLAEFVHRIGAEHAPASPRRVGKCLTVWAACSMMSSAIYPSAHSINSVEGHSGTVLAASSGISPLSPEADIRDVTWHVSQWATFGIVPIRIDI
jgi:hypothetical protein